MAALRREEAKPRLALVARRKADPVFDAAEKLLESGDLAGADAAYRKLSIESPSDPLVLSRWGLVQERGGDASLANDHYTRALDIDPRCADAHANKAIRTTTRPRRSLRKLDLAIQLDPTCLRAYERAPSIGSCTTRTPAASPTARRS